MTVFLIISSFHLKQLELPGCDPVADPKHTDTTRHSQNSHKTPQR